MNSIWNNNISQFCNRFPQLAKAFSLTQQSDEPKNIPWKLITAKNGSITAEENGVLLHSAYNPEREAQKSAEASQGTGIFLGCGLGYGPIAFSHAHENETLIIIEPEPDYFFSALSVIDWTTIFSHKMCIIALAAKPEDIFPIVEKSGGVKNCTVFSSPAQSAHAQNYFDSLKSLLQRNRKKDEINNSTLERFANLWLRSSCQNLHWIGELEGVSKFKDACCQKMNGKNLNLPALILAAGPTLSEVLPQLVELKKRTIIICVDTALRACLQTGVEPDFIIVVDPQYYAWLHIAGLSSPSSVMITESAAYPPVYRFKCKETVLCSSLFPLGKYFEKKIGSKGELGAGGSVSTTAWDFARLCGAKTIYVAGLDLGYPSLETHIRGSTFEEVIHRTSRRTHTSETSGVSSLFGANMTKAKDYDGNEILTDDRMKLFAWWFESKAATYSDIQTFSLSSRSLAIPGFKTATVDSIIFQNEKTDLRELFFKKAQAHSIKPNQSEFNKTLTELSAGFENLYHIARKGESEAEKTLQNLHSSKKNSSAISESLLHLDSIDSEISHSELKDAAALVFPTEQKLNKLFLDAGVLVSQNQNISMSKEQAITATLTQSKIIYRELQKAILSYKTYLSKD